ncbi:MAG: hypothetical protein RXP86_11965 [Acidilobus sp.]
MVVQSEEELRRVQESWRLTRDRKGFKIRGPGGRWERVSRDLEVVAAELYGAQRSERGGRTRGCEGLLKEKERQCLEELSKCPNAYRPLLLKSLKLILELWQLAKGYEKGSPALPKEARDSLVAYVIPKARRLFIEIANVLKEKEGLRRRSPGGGSSAHRALSPTAAVSPEAGRGQTTGSFRSRFEVA